VSGATTAVAIGAGVAGAATLGGAIISSNAAKSAASEQAAAENQATAAQQQIYAQNQANIQPYIDAGNSATTEVEQLEGLNGGTPSSIQNTLQQLPGYQFANTQGLKSVQNSATSRGLGVSGAALKGAANYSTGLAEQDYNNLLTGVQNTANMGANAAGGLANVGATTGQGIAATTVGAGNALAQGTTGSANAIASGLGNVGSLVYANSILSGINGQSGGAGGFNSSNIPVTSGDYNFLSDAAASAGGA
jgi:hypothetical protein